MDPLNTANDEAICILREKIARLEERLFSSDKALELARNAMNSQWTNAVAIVSMSISVVALVMQFLKK